MKKALLPILASIAVLAAPGCIVPVNGPIDGTSTTGSSASGAIVIQGLSANPTGTDISAGDRITFTVNAFDNNGLPMQYSWSSTKGTMSSTSGQTAYWIPDDPSTGNLIQGVATVQVLITDSSGASQVGAVNLEVAPNPAPTPAPSSTPAASASPAPSATPTPETATVTITSTSSTASVTTP